MKGHVAHAGFPEAAYGKFSCASHLLWFLLNIFFNDCSSHVVQRKLESGYNADRLVMAGYKVARVEQTETPDQLAVRKKKHKKGNGPAPKVVNREVCSILSLGTRTFCYLDDCKFLDIDESANHTSNTGPLLVIREVEYAQEENTNNDDNCASAACEYGVTLVDAIRGTVTMGQFADDNLRSRMQTLLASFSPCEVRIPTTVLPKMTQVFLLTIMLNRSYCKVGPKKHRPR